MTAEEYIGRSNALRLEMARIREILDWHAHAKAKGITTDAAPLIKKTYLELDDAVRLIRELDQEFWGDLIP